MKQFVERPNLPHNAGAVILGEKYADILDNSLKKLGLTPVYVPDNPFVDKRLAGHTDLSVFHAGGEQLILAPYLRGSAFAKQLEALGAVIRFADIEQGEHYPHDAQLNACLIGERLICAHGITAKEIIEEQAKRGAQPVFTRQGYAKCSVCVVDSHSIITADPAIAEKGRAAGLDVLKIEPGSIRLDGFDYGFPGGSSFKLSDTKLCFTGTLSAHPDREKIFDFLAERKIECVFLTDEPIFDIGSAIPFTEQ